MTEVQVEAAIAEISRAISANQQEANAHHQEMREMVAALGQEIAIVKANQISTMAAITEVSSRISAAEGRQFAFFMGVLGIFGTAFAGLLFKLLDFTKLPIQ
jgi:predicted  nucleic acid-binding Zn-ribbon protein